MQKGQYITDGSKGRKVLEVLGDLVFTSYSEGTGNWETTAAFPCHIEELKRTGWHVEEDREEDWTPEFDEMYWIITSNGDVGWSCWHDSHCDDSYKNFLGIFKTKEAAQKRLAEIKEKLKK